MIRLKSLHAFLNINLSIKVRKFFPKKNPKKIIQIPVTVSIKPLELLVRQCAAARDALAQKTFSTSVLMPRYHRNLLSRLRHENFLDVQKILLIK